MKYALFDFVTEEGAIDIGETAWIVDANPDDANEEDFDMEQVVIVEWRSKGKLGRRVPAKVLHFSARHLVLAVSYHGRVQHVRFTYNSVRWVRMGLPQVLKTDWGIEFVNKLNDELMKGFGIDHRLTSPHHPHANCLDERWNQTLQNVLVKFVDEKKAFLDYCLDTCVFVYKTSRHESFHFSPFELIFFRKPVLPIDMDMRKKNAEGNGCIKYTDYGGGNPKLVDTTGRVHHIDIQEGILYYSQQGQRNPDSVYLFRVDWTNLATAGKTGIAVLRGDKGTLLGDLTKTDPPVEKKLRTRLVDEDNATCLELAHTDHYTL
ncbi:hypothetical protein LSAT2_025152 [Lamellibrachia satsuma]|nr:hypothetical protein LSAT2_025152 [Lamellibrachia satsuma]